MSRFRRLAFGAFFVAAVAACGGGEGGGDSGDGADGGATSIPYDTLSEYGLFEDAPAQVPAAGVVPYEVNTVLFADESRKFRFIAFPDGEAAQYRDLDVWDFPVGTILVKTFWYPHDANDPSAGRRLIETRLIIREESGWRGETYVWNDAQTEAVHEVAGRTVPVTWVDEAGETRQVDYRVPNNNDCLRCHSKSKVFEPLGPRTPYLDRDNDYGAGPENQIDHLVAAGHLAGDIPPADERVALVNPFDESAPLEDRARSYLEANCAHCHQPAGFAASSGLDLRWDAPYGPHLGVCKTPVAAGRGGGGLRYTLVPGDPDASILVFRMESTDPGIKMPELPTMTSDADGVALVRAWIESLPAVDCDAR